jgi:outer membrane protein OmpA-like peptidoglycan-associated protein
MKIGKFTSRATCLAALAASLAIAPSRAEAQYNFWDEPWFFNIQGVVAGPLNDLALDRYDVGGGGSFGVYRSFFPWLAFGLRVGAGALSGGGPLPQDPVDRGALDWGQLSAAARFRPFAGMMDHDRRATSLFVEVGVGPWLIDGDVDPVFNATIGYGFGIGPVVLAPIFNFTHIWETHDRFASEPILIGSGGLEFSWNDHVRTHEVEIVTPVTLVEERQARRAPREAMPTPLPPEQDIAQPFVNDQLIIDERVFFDYDGWQLRSTGVEQLEEVVRRYHESGGSWEALVISGHADRRGPPGYNIDLSRKRADTVRDFLTSRGVPGEILEIQAWGEELPEIPNAETEWEHQVNRRVQFEIVWRPGMRPEGATPESHPTMPDYVDPAPEDRRDLP